MTKKRKYYDIKQVSFIFSKQSNKVPTAFDTPIYKKDDPNKCNYRLINSLLTPYLCGYTKGLSTLQALLSLIEKWTIVLDLKYYGGNVFMDLSKAFDTIIHDLLNCIPMDFYMSL